MKKNLLTLLVSTAIILSKHNCNSQNIALNFDANYKPIARVTLTGYKSVQSRDIKRQNPNIALGVSIAGGGSRAQYFGTGVLLGLEEIASKETPSSNFLQEIDYFSTVSGGCYAAGYFLTIQKNILNKSNKTFNDFYFSKGNNFQDFIGKSAAPALALAPNKNITDIEYSMSKRLDYEVLQYSASDNKGKFSSQMTLSDFFIPISEQSKIPTLPMFVPNATIFHNGERLPFMPHILSSLKITNSLTPNAATLPTVNDGTVDAYKLPLTYAITSSSAFPAVLPVTRYGIKGDDKILCVVDGGIVDNLGYTTLLELLHKDRKVTNRNKRALIVDCSGAGEPSQLINDKEVTNLQILQASLEYTLSTKYLYLNENIQSQMAADSIPTENALVIGFSTIKNHLRTMLPDHDFDVNRNKFLNTKDKNQNWFQFYTEFKTNLSKRFKNSFILDTDKEIILSSLSSKEFKNLTASEVLVLYEYASQVVTKLKIYPDEKEMLILAGRYTVYLEQERIKQLLATKN